MSIHNHDYTERLVDIPNMTETHAQPHVYNTECPLCSDPVSQFDRNIIVLECGHIYHSQTTKDCGGFLSMCIKFNRHDCAICSKQFYEDPDAGNSTVFYIDGDVYDVQDLTVEQILRLFDEDNLTRTESDQLDTRYEELVMDETANMSRLTVPVNISQPGAPGTHMMWLLENNLNPHAEFSPNLPAREPDVQNVTPETITFHDEEYGLLTIPNPGPLYPQPYSNIISLYNDSSDEDDDDDDE